MYVIILCFIPLLHRFTGIHALIVSVFLLYGSLYILHELLLMDIPVFPLHDCFPLRILIFSLLDMGAVDMRCVELGAMWVHAMGATSRIPRLLFFLVSRYLVS